MKKPQPQTNTLQAIVQVGFVTALGAATLLVAGAGCARKNSDPPTVQGYGMQGQLPGSKLGAAEHGNVPNKNAVKLLKLILADKKVLSFVAIYEKKNGVTCTRPTEGQINWNCKTDTQCAFSVESTCITDVGVANSNDQLVRLSMLGEGDAAKMTYKISDPSATAAESKVVRVNFEY